MQKKFCPSGSGGGLRYPVNSGSRARPHISVKLTPKHEQLIRKAPHPYQDSIAKVILTREEVSPPNKSSDEFPIAPSKRAVLSIAETARFVNMVVETPALDQPLLADLLNNPQEKRIVRNGQLSRKPKPR